MIGCGAMGRGRMMSVPTPTSLALDHDPRVERWDALREVSPSVSLTSAVWCWRGANGTSSRRFGDLGAVSAGPSPAVARATRELGRS